MERRLQEWEKFIEDDQNTPMTSEENTKNTQQTSSSSQLDMSNMTKTDNPINEDASNANASEIVDPTSPTGDETPPQMEGSSDEDDDAVS